MSKTAILKAQKATPSAQKTRAECFAIEIKKQLKTTALWYQDIARREALDWIKNPSDGLLDSQVKFVNEDAINMVEREPNMFVEALYAFDVEAVGALISAGANVCQWYTCPYGILNLDPIAHALYSYTMRARVYGDSLARQAWARRCAECVRLLVDAGASQWVAEYVGPECAPVLACDCLRGIQIRGLESVKLKAEKAATS